MAVLEITKQLLGLVPASDGGWIIDGGCHTGEFASHAINNFPASNILSFEPDPDSWAAACNNLGSHNQIEVANAALGASNGQAELYRGPYSMTNSLLPRPEGGLRPYYPEQASLEGGTIVDVVTIDDECEKRGIRELDILKLDLQGGELDALHGARGMLESGLVKVIIVEAVFIRKYKDQPLLWEIGQFLDERGYSLYSFEDIKIGLYHKENISLRHRQWNQCDLILISNSIRNVLDKQ